MKSVRFGRSDLMVSKLCFGCVSFGVADPAQDWDPFTPEGRKQSLRLISVARELGVNLFDTSPDYGDGHAEVLLGEAFRTDRDKAILATKVDYGGQSPEDVTASVDSSLRRLGTDYIDIIQFHGGNYPSSSVKRIMQRGLLEALERLRSDGKVRHIGLTVADPITARDLIESGSFDTIQMLYSLVEQAAARHALKWATAQDMGITVMRPLAAGMLLPLFRAIAPAWADETMIAETCIKFLLCDERVHTINVGMRTEDELRKNVALIDGYDPAIKIEDLPRSVGQAARAVVK